MGLTKPIEQNLFSYQGTFMYLKDIIRGGFAMSKGPKIGEKKKFSVPHVFILLFAIIVICTVLTWIVPAGEFDRVEGANGRMLAVAGTWHEVESSPVGIFQMFRAVYDGMLNAADISMLIFLCFASTSFIIKSGAFDGLVVFLMKIFKGNSSVIIIPIFMALFGLGSSTVVMFEEWLPFIPVFASIFIGIGYDAIVGLAVVTLGAGLGYSGAFMNPFTVGVAQGIAEVDYMSGAGYRILCHLVMLAVASALVIRYALKVKKDPTASIVYGMDFSELSASKDVENKEFGIRQALVLIDLLGCIILIVLQAGNIIDTIVYALSVPLAAFPAWLTGVAMLIMQTVLNFFIPSGSGQAATSMPIMAPLADMLGVIRDVAVLAFQFGDGLSNIVWPTGFAAVMAGLAGVKLDKWWKFIFPIFGILVLTQAVLLVIAVVIGFGA